MMAKSHYWVVSDAVAYIKQFGTDKEKRALQTFELAYGSAKPVDEIPPHHTAVERLVGFESLHTDKFGDLALSLKFIPGQGKRNVVGLGFHMFTAFNHFINPFPESDVPWPGSSGYAYETSSMKGIDSLVVKGISEHLFGTVDVENSLVLDRLRNSWEAGDQAWVMNFSQSLSTTKFAPWNVLTRVYYAHLINNHYEPLEVRGPNRFIVGFQLLGPVVHAAADACSVQHVRSTLGFGHVIWENYLKAKCYNRQINANVQKIRDFLADEAFSSVPVLKDGPRAECFDIGAFVNQLAAKTAERLQASTKQDWKKLWRAGDDFWRKYLLGAAMREDADYLYNMAVAATVQVLSRSCEDMVRHGILDPAKGLAHPHKLPKLDLVQDNYPELPAKKTIDGIPSEDVMPTPCSKPEDILGFSTMGDSDLQSLLKHLSSLMTNGDSDSKPLKDVLTKIENQIIEQYQRMSRAVGESFCPLRALEKIPIDSDLSAHFGTATFRMPSSDECDDPRLFERYIELSDAHAAKAYKLQLTQVIAGLKFTLRKFEAQPMVAQRFNRLIQDIQSLRDGAIEQWASSVREAESPTRHEAASSQPVSEKIMTAIRQWLSPMFRVPVTALATVAATILLLVVLIPHGVQEPFVGFSTEKWEQPSISLMAPKSVTRKPVLEKPVSRPRLAILLYFKDFKKRPSQEEIDALYRAARPTVGVRRHFEAVPPEQVSQALSAEKKASVSVEQVLKTCKTNLNLARVLVITITAKGDAFIVESSLHQLDTGAVTVVTVDKPVERGALESAIAKQVETQIQG